MKKKILKRTIIVTIIILLMNALLLINFGGEVVNKSNEVINQVGDTTIDGISKVYTQMQTKNQLDKDKKLLASDNNSLKEQNRILSNENATLNAENEELKAQISAINRVKEKNPEYQYIPGEIIRRDSNDWYDQATINLGSNDGITSGSAVMYRGTLMGYVNDVEANYATIKLITSENVVINIPAMAKSGKKNYNGQMSHFDKNDNTFIFESFSPDKKLKLHDKIYTNGYTKGVPAGIEIGTITDVVEDQKMKKTIYKIKPGEDLYNARYITVMEENAKN